MQAERVVEVTFGDRSAGSGYLIAPRHVLTARHVVAPRRKGTRCTVRLLVTQQLIDAQVEWFVPDKQEPDLDVAIIKLDQQPNANLEPMVVTFGAIAVNNIEPHSFLCVGFPVAAGVANLTVTGTLAYVPGPKRFDLTVLGALPRRWQEWAGLSGAVVFCGGRAVGVVRMVKGRFDRLLTATPVELLIAHHSFLIYWRTQKLPDPIIDLVMRDESTNGGEGLQNYLNAVKDKHVHFNMIDLRRTIALKDIYVTLKLDRSGNLDLPEPIIDDNQIQEVGVESVLENKRLVILGNPGGGKTTLLQHLVYTYADAFAEKSLVPIFVRLAVLSKHHNCDLNSWLDHFYPQSTKLLKLLLDDGKCLVLFDGLDETDRGNWEGIREEANRLAALGNHVVLSCRTVVYPRGFLSKEFQVYHLMGFNEAQQRQFLTDFFRDKPEKAKDLLVALQGHERRQQIMATPLLLTLTAVLYDNGSLLLPIRRVKLYELATDFLVRRWNQIRVPGQHIQFDAEDKRKFLAKLAFDYFQASKEIFERRELLERIRDWQRTEDTLKGDRNALLRELSEHDGFLVDHGDDAYRFLHLSFHSMLKFFVLDGLSS